MKFMKNMTFRPAIFFVLGGLIGGIFLASISIFTMREELKRVAFTTLEAIKETKKQQVEGYFSMIKNQCETAGQNLMFVEAVREFKNGYDLLENEPKKRLVAMDESIAPTISLEDYYRAEFLPRLSANTGKDAKVEDYLGLMSKASKKLQTLYIARNPNPIGKKEGLDDAKDGSAYSKIHAKYHPILREYLKNFKYYDIFLVDIETGLIVYTCSKEVDFGTSLLSGAFKGTNIAKLFYKLQQAQKPGFVELVNFEFYEPSYGTASSFIGTPVFENGKKIGALIFQISLNEINRITTNNKRWLDTGLGKTGEVILVGHDYKMRSDSRFMIEDPEGYLEFLTGAGEIRTVVDKIKLLKSTVLVQEMATDSAREAVRGNSNTIVEKGYRSKRVISSFAPVHVVNIVWGIVVSIDYAEILSPLNRVIVRVVLGGIVCFALMILFGLMLIYRGRRDVNRGR